MTMHRYLAATLVWSTFAMATTAQGVTFTVTSAADAEPAPPGSLRQAILDANAARGSAANPIKIAFSTALLGKTVALAKHLPVLTGSHVTLEVPAANPAQRLVLDSGPTGLGVIVVSGDVVRFANFVFLRATGDTVQCYGNQQVEFVSCEFRNAKDLGLYLVGARQITCRDCTFSGSATGILAVDAADDLRVERCTFQGVGAIAISLAGQARATVTDSLFTGCGGGIFATEVVTDLVVGPGNQFVGNGGHGIDAALLRRATIRGNSFRQNGMAGLAIRDRSADVTVEANTFDGNGTTTAAPNCAVEWSQRVTFRQNTLRNGTGPGLVLLGSRDVTFVADAPGNLIETCRSSGLVIAQQSEDVVCEGLVCQGNSTAVGTPQLTIVQSKNIWLRACKIQNGRAAGIQVDRSSAVSIGAGTQVLANVREGIVLTEATDVVIGPRNPADPVETGCTISGNGGAVLFDRARSCRLNGNTVLANGQTVLGQNQDAIKVLNGSDSCQIGPACAITVAAPIAIAITAQATGTTIRDCAVSGATTTSLFVSDVGPGTVRNTTFTGTATSGPGVLLDRAPGWQLFFVTSQDHKAGAGFVLQNATGMLVGPGCTALRNGKEGFLVQRPAAPTTAVIQSSAAVHNGSGAGGIVCVGGADLTVAHCTSAGTHRWGIAGVSGARLTVANSVFFGNQIDRYVEPGVTATMVYSDFVVQAGAGSWGGGTGNRSVDPLFTNLAGGDVHLRATSPLRDVASATAAQMPAVDFDNEPRTRGNNPDMGADEMAAAGPGPGEAALWPLGECLREPDRDRIELQLTDPAHAGALAVLVASSSGTTGGLRLAGSAVLPLRPDVLTQAWLGAPALCLVPLDANGQATRAYQVPVGIVQALGGELTFAFSVLPALDFASNAVVVRYYR